MPRAHTSRLTPMLRGTRDQGPISCKKHRLAAWISANLGSRWMRGSHAWPAPASRSRRRPLPSPVAVALFLRVCASRLQLERTTAKMHMSIKSTFRRSPTLTDNTVRWPYCDMNLPADSNDARARVGTERCNSASMTLRPVISVTSATRMGRISAESGWDATSVSDRQAKHSGTWQGQPFCLDLAYRTHATPAAKNPHQRPADLSSPQASIRAAQKLSRVEGGTA